MEQIHNTLVQSGITALSFKLEVFEQKVSMESWFLGNRRIFKSNPQDQELRRYVSHYNVRDNDPELMENIDNDEFSTNAQFHHSYLKKIFPNSTLNIPRRNPLKCVKNIICSELLNDTMQHNTLNHLAVGIHLL